MYRIFAKKFAVVCILCFGSVIAGCGGGDDEGPAPSSSQPPSNSPPSPTAPPGTGGSGNIAVDLEPNNLITNAVNASLPFTASGTVNDITDVSDVYRFTASSSGNLVAYLSDYGFYDLDLILLDSGGSQIDASASATDPEEMIEYSVVSGRIYYLEVMAYNTAQSDSSYSLSVSMSGSNYSNPPPPPPSTTSGMTFVIADHCNDGYRIEYKFYDVDNNLVWPSSTTYYYTEYYDHEYEHNLSCISGAMICYGGETGNRYWGVDVDKSKSCDDCCYVCTHGAEVGVNLVCD